MRSLRDASRSTMPDADLQRIGLAISRVRRYRSFTQEGLAEVAELNLRHLGDVERGVTDVKWSTLKRIANALDVPVSTIVGAYEEPPPRRRRRRR